MSKLSNALVLALDRIDLFGARARGLALVGMLRALRRLTERVRARVAAVEVGGAAREPERGTPPQPPPPSGPAPIDTLREASRWIERRDAALALRAHPGEATREALLAALSDPAVEVALAACEALVEVGVPDDVPRLLALARSGTSALHPFTRAGVVWAAGTQAGPAHLEALRALVHDVNTEVSSAAIEAVGRVADEGALEELWRVVEDDRDYFLPMSRGAAARALAARGALDAERVSRLLRSETDPVVRTALGG